MSTVEQVVKVDGVVEDVLEGEYGAQGIHCLQPAGGLRIPGMV